MVVPKLDVAVPADLFDALADVEVSAAVTRRARSLASHYGGPGVHELERAVELAEWLLRAGEAEWADAVSAVVAREQFTGGFERWTWIQTAAVLRVAIARRAGDPEEHRLTASTRERFAAGLAPESDDVMASLRRAVLAERLSCDGLWASMRDKTRKAEESGNDAAVFPARIRYWEELQFVALMGGSESFPVADAEALVREQEAPLSLETR